MVLQDEELGLQGCVVAVLVGLLGKFHSLGSSER